VSSRAPTVASRGRRTPSISEGEIARGVVAAVLRKSLARGQLRSQLLGYLWTELKLFGASNVENVPVSRIRGINDVRVQGTVLRHGLLVLCALASLLECERIFTFAAGLDATALASNLPDLRIFRLAPPAPEPLARVHQVETPGAHGVTRLVGDPDTFDFSPYSGAIDLVHIDAAEADGDIRSRTDAAFSLLSELGSIVWDNYPHSAGAYGYLNHLAPTLDRPIFHIVGTRLALYSRWDIVRPDD
jgi:hypothetical protein